jgi:DNA-binding GntR family transcriptional regulator
MKIKLDKKCLKDRTYEIIRETILKREIEPGKKINEEELSRKIGVSRTPLREALCRLENEQIVKSTPQRGSGKASVLERTKTLKQLLRDLG